MEKADTHQYLEKHSVSVVRACRKVLVLCWRFEVCLDCICMFASSYRLNVRNLTQSTCRGRSDCVLDEVFRSR